MKSIQSDQYFNIDMQLRMNTQLFKANFETIVQILINRMWTKVQSETASNLQDQNAEAQSHEEIKEQECEQDDHSSGHAEEELSPSQQSLQQKKEQTQIQILSSEGQVMQQLRQQRSLPLDLNKDSSPKKTTYQLVMNKVISQASQNSFKQLPGNSDDSLVNQSWVRKQLNLKKQQNSQSNLKQDPAYILHSSQDVLSKKDQQSQSNSKVLYADLRRQQEKKLTNLSQNLSMTSLRSQNANNQSKNMTNVPYSEIQTDVRANTSFSRAQRDCVVGKANVEYSPGPGEYRMESSVNAVRKASPNTKFEKSAKVCWIDEKLRYDSSVQSPGPKYDYQKSKTSRLKKPKKPKK